VLAAAEAAAHQQLLQQLLQQQQAAPAGMNQQQAHQPPLNAALGALGAFLQQGWHMWGPLAAGAAAGLDDDMPELIPVDDDEEEGGAM